MTELESLIPFIRLQQSLKRETDELEIELEIQ
jgi:hypothetical protein